MVAVSKFYLHRDTTGIGGTLPAGGTSISVTTPTHITSGGDVNRVMDATISAVAQTSITHTTVATTTSQSALMLRFVSDTLSAQTVTVGGVTLSIARAESNLNSNFQISYVIYVWRPSSGASVGAVRELGHILAENTSAGVQQAISSNSGVGGSVVASAGDVLVMEVWRYPLAQSHATAYTNDIYYDGTTEASTTDIASFVQFDNSVDIAAAPPPVERVPYRNQMPTLIAQ